MTAILKREYRVLRVSSGEAALPILNREDVDLMLLDVRLPGISGYEVARRLRQNPRLKTVKLVAMTGYGNEADRQLAKEAGFDKHLVKPVDFPTVKSLLITMLKPSVPEG